MREVPSFPRQYARTRRFTLGQPRTLTVGHDGARVAFLRSPAGDDPSTCLWVLEVSSGRELLAADPRALLAKGGEDLPPDERARRERTRESAGGIVGYATDRDATCAAFALSGRLFLADLRTGSVDGRSRVRELDVPGPVIDPRPDPTGRRVAYVRDGSLRAVDVESGTHRTLAAHADPDVTWGLAEFIAAEEMDRFRGFWWAPDGAAVLAARVDNRPVQRWHLTDPADPAARPTVLRYPAAGTANAAVSLAVLAADGSSPAVNVDWDGAAFPYLAAVDWSPDGPPTLAVQARDQRSLRVLAVAPNTGGTRLLREDVDPVWVEPRPGVPAWLPDGRLVWIADRAGARRLLFDDEPVTPPDLQVRAVCAVTAGGVLVTASGVEPAEVHLWQVGPQGAVRRLTDEPGVHGGTAGGDTVVVSSSTLSRDHAVIAVRRGDRTVTRLSSYAETPVLTPRVRLRAVGGRALGTALLLPIGWERGSGRLPVLLDPYGGPHAQRVLAARSAYLSSQWFADQGFAVLVADGRGTPGRGLEWERAIAGDLATAPLADQVEALHAVAATEPDLDLSRVAIRGWSFGGYLAALAVLRRPDVFGAAVAGAPVTEWRLYDTHYTERYLGRPEQTPEAYQRSSLLEDAARLERPLMLIHGLADDNVVAAHSLRLSSALLAAGRPHTVLPLSGVTHMTPQEVVAENLLLLQVAFLRSALGMDRPPLLLDPAGADAL